MTEKTLLSGTPEERILTCLRAAGWHKGRRADLTKIREFYAAGGITLPAGAERFLREFHGLAGGWYFNIPVEKQAGRAPDIEFRLFPDNSWGSKEYFNENYAKDYTEDLEKISGFAGEPLVWIGSIGYYYTDSIYMGTTSKIFALQDDGKIRTYLSLADLFMWDFSHHPNWEYVTMRRD